jgi:N-carbamoyl-L-amino-acid hydrolase
MTPSVRVNLDRLTGELDRLAAFSDAEPPAVTRVLFTPPDLAARAFLKELFAGAGLDVTEDPAGNVFARWQGQDPSLPAVATGSHADAIPHSGRYDGTVGVLGALEAIRALQAAGCRPARSIELVLFTSEEPTRFGIGCLGSRLLSGMLSPTRAAGLKDAGGRTFDEVRQEAGYCGSLDAVRLRVGHYAAFVELHIEQGPLLEQEQVPIGVVTAIAAPALLRVEVQGAGGHAGTVLMSQRHDALCGAAETILSIETAARTSGSLDTVATVGVCNVHPGASNSIPSRVTLEIDIRDIDLERRDRVVEQIKQTMASKLGQRGLDIRADTLNADPPARCGQRVIDAVQGACRQLGLNCKAMVSRAYHDSLFMARVCPTGMIFIPCRAGVSHRPDEYSGPEAMGLGVQVLALTLLELAGTASFAI